MTARWQTRPKNHVRAESAPQLSNGAQASACHPSLWRGLRHVHQCQGQGDYKLGEALKVSLGIPSQLDGTQMLQEGGIGFDLCNVINQLARRFQILFDII